jgi:cytochrome c oxidase subunit 3
MEAILTYDEIDRREDTVRLGLWMFLATVTMLFAAFTSAYIVRRAGTDWQPIGLPPILWLSTIMLAMSSGALEAGVARGLRGQWPAASAALGAAIALGAAFLCAQAAAWQSLMAAGVYLQVSPHSSFFYVMTGAHAVHVVAALIVLMWGGVKTWNGTGRRRLREWRSVMSRCRTFWHFLLGVWVYLFALIAWL